MADSLRIDAHLHMAEDHPRLLALLEEMDLKILNVCVARDAEGKWRTQADRYADLARRFPRRFGWVTSFDIPGFDDPAGYARKVTAQLQRDFEAGAVGCKFWKNFGMEIRDPSGRFVLVDDPILEPIFGFLEERGLPALMHIAEPRACWRPLVAGEPHFDYYSRNPEWHMHGKSGYPSHEELIASRDNVLRRHPRLRAVGAHLGSMEHDVDEVARRLEEFPNFAVDVSARLKDLGGQDTGKVRAFILKYADRVLFGTDIVHRKQWSELPEAELPVAGLRGVYQQSYDYFESAGPVQLPTGETRGLALPAEVLAKLYRQNARRWYPGL